MTSTVVGAQRLRESEARLKLATEVAKLGVFVWDTVEDKGSWENDRMYEIFGRSRGENPVSGTEFLRDVVHPDYRDSFREAVERTVRNGDPFQFEGSIYLPDKTIRCIEINGNLQTEPEVPKGRILGTVRDVTENRRTEEAMRVSARHLAELAAIVESSDDVIVSKTLDGIITSWNAAATRVFGYTADEIIGQSILKLIPEHLHPDEKIIITCIKAGKRMEHFDTVRVTKDGRLIDVSLTVSPIRDAAGIVIGASKILRDISVRKRMEQSLLQAEKIAATGRMAATMAHEINNPLEAVVNLLYLLRPTVNPEGLRFLTTAESELARVSHIAKQTLGYYREQSAATNADLSNIAEHAIAIYKPRCMGAGIAIRESLESSRRIMLRRGEMMQVISNLITNSIYGMPSGGTLSISAVDTDTPSPGVVLTVADDGEGIAPEILPKVFEAFFTTRATVGTGIGLFIAKQFIQGHGGEIDIESSIRAEDHGTSVRVFIPAHTAYEVSGACL
jgi:PAS domain S-box-containing protein